MKTAIAITIILSAFVSGCATLSNASLAVKIKQLESNNKKLSARLVRLEGTVLHIDSIQKLRGSRLDEIESDVLRLQQKEAVRVQAEKARKKGKP